MANDQNVLKLVAKIYWKDSPFDTVEEVRSVDIGEAIIFMLLDIGTFGI